VRALTGADGTVSLPRAVAGTLAIAAAAPGLAPSDPLTIAEASAEIRLATGCPRRVEAVDPQGKPVPGTVIALGAAGVPVGTTGEDGALRVGLPCDRKATLRYRAADGRRGRESVAPPPAGAEPPPVRLALAAAPRPWSGKVVEKSSGRPIADALVWPADDPGAAVRTGAQGIYLLAETDPESETLVAASSRTWMAAADLKAAIAEAAKAAAGGGTPRPGPALRLELSGRLAGTVVDEKGAAVDAADVAVVYAGGMSTGPGGNGLFTHTRPDGSFRLRLPPGMAFDLNAEHPLFRPATSSLKPFAAGEQRAGLRLVLRRARGAFGRVVDASEQPVAGAEVQLSPGDRTNFRMRSFLELRRQALKVPTGPDGRFTFASLPDPPFDLRVRAGGFAPVIVPGLGRDEAPESGPLDLGTILLQRGASLEGIVVDPSEHPIAGAEVEPSASREMDSFQIQDRLDGDSKVSSGLDGRFRLDDLQPGKPVALAVSKEGYQGATVGRIEVPQDQPVKVVLEPTFRIAGTVRDEAGEPVAGAGVGLAVNRPAWPAMRRMRGRNVEGWATTDDQGRFELHTLETGRLRLDVTAKGLVAGGTDLEVREPHDVEGVEIVLKRGATLVGKVTGADGAPLEEVSIQSEDKDRGMLAFNGAWGSEMTGADGTYRLTGLKEGKQRLTASRNGWRRLEREIDIRPGENRLDLRLESALSVEGRVLDPDGHPSPSSQVVLAGNHQQTGVETGGDGTFSLPDVEPGTYRIWAQHPQFAAGDRQELTVAATPVRGIDLHLSRGGALHGRVTGVEFQDLPDVRIHAVLPAGEDASWKDATLDYKGEYRMGGMAPGEWAVSATFGGRRVEGSVTLPPDGGEAELDLDFKAGHTVSGRILRGGAPVGDLNVLAQGREGQSPAYAASDSRGVFRLEGLATGTYTLQVIGMATGILLQREIQVPAEGELLLELPNQTIRGRVIDGGDGSPVDGAMVSLQAQGAGRPEMIVPPTGMESDRDGMFAFTGLAAGRYKVVAEKEGFSRSETTLDLSEGGDADGLRLELRRADPFSIRVLSAAGTPLPEITAALVQPATGQVASLVRRQPDETGKVEIDALPGGWDLVVGADGRASVTQPIVIPGPPPTVILPAAGYLAVSVPALEASDAGGTLQLFAGQGGTPFRDTSAFGQVDDRFPIFRGRAMVRNLPPGSWILAATAADGRTFRGTVTTQAGGSASAVLEAAQPPPTKPPT
jgi:protocatechuate 3,4-dioxygenase beta subunit